MGTHMNLNDDLGISLKEMGLADGPVDIRALSGGVSCDVFVVSTRSGTFCVKRALPKLRVEADWRAPAERSEAEVAWMRLVAGLDRDWVPAILGEHSVRHLFAMQYFPPETFPVWKSLLAGGAIDPGFAAKVGEALGCIHAATAGRDDIAAAFANGVQFHALRVDAYLLHTAAKHEDVGPTIRVMADELCRARIALMHGDISPKNILAGPKGPVFLDAETCCYGDPAFDLAFCLNHLLLKAVWHPEFAAQYSRSFQTLKEAYFGKAQWEPRPELERRTAGFLAAFLLARIDGKSPVEYITDTDEKAYVRAAAKMFLKERVASLAEIQTRWAPPQKKPRASS